MAPIIVLLLSPAVIGPLSTGIISLIKRLPKVENTESQSKRNLLLRGLGAVLSLGGVVGAFFLTGIFPDIGTVQDIVVTLMLVATSFLTANGTHAVLKK